MEVKDVEKCCCVVKVFETFLGKKAVSCSGVIVDPQTGIILCTGLPFSRFIADKKEPLSADQRFISPHSFSEKLKIRVSFPPDLDASLSAHEEALSPSRNKTTQQREVAAELLMLVNCLEFKHAFQALFQEADQWSFHGNEEDDMLIKDAQFLSWFAILKASEIADSSQSSCTIPWQSSSSLQKGCPVVACGSPFGSLCLDLFISTLSRGIISNLAGEDNAVILTDARCLPGTEGGGLFVVKDADVRLIGLIVSPFGWKANEWIGLTLVCSIHLIFKSIINCMSVKDPLRDVWLHKGEAELLMSTTAQESNVVKYPTVCLVDSGQLWGSGVAVTSQLVVTCRHVVNGKPTVTLKFHHKDRVHDVIGDVLFSTKASSPYDLALVQMRDSVKKTLAPHMAQSFNPGIVSSNTRDIASKVTYPHLNFSIPVTVFQGLLQHFDDTKDADVFRELDTTEQDVRRVWRLQGAPSKL
ncbi:peroxisomal leader peptide-processing protease isoform X2 [Cheilinus undulatus]|uniref:peroxisomal leader peptide-processing protease isoform X2 n=1 Tax=Cheilinus undulatus TaxID=241271 RepID=UPI001BD4A37C|nr:peroxisomal leader peptide-processing protease isoform X2 [Cheilinus undulatus]